MIKIEEKYIVFIINAGAGKRKADRILSELKKYSPGSTFIVTQDEKDFDDIFLGQANDRKVFVAVGGDGTVRKVMAHLLGTNHLLGIIPTDSGNGFARQLGIGTNIRDAVNNMKCGETISVDALKVNGQWAISVAGLGFDAEVAYRFSRLGVRGLVGYFFSGLQALWCFNLFYANISGQFIKEAGVYCMIIIANAGQYGNNAQIAQQSLYNDGLMNLVLVKPFPLVMLPVFIFKLFTGKLKPSKYVKYIKTKGPVTINTSLVKLHIDGDPVDIDNLLEVTLVPSAIQVVIPVRRNKSDLNETES